MAISFDWFRSEDRSKFKGHHFVHTKTGDGLELIVLTGVVAIHQKGQSESTWRREQVDLTLPVPHLPRGKVLKLRNWAPFLTINAIYNKEVANHSGFAVDEFRLISSGDPRGVLVQADIAIRDTDAWLYRIAYHVTLTGRFEDPELI